MTSKPSAAKEKNEEMKKLDNNMGGSFTARTGRRIVLPFNANDAIDLDS